ncbi:MAG: phosphonate ABC transporter, permease protein PhnE [Anaerolineae bacterium]|nr:phosphonate ABC transporter, permease protein PhnE [Anaerolineae bacterium]
MSAALLGLLPPLMAGLLGGQVVSLIYQRFAGEIRPIDQLKRTIRNIAFWVGAIIAFVITFQLLNIGRALVDGILPSSEPSNILQLPLYIAESGIIGLVLGGLVGALTGIHTNFMLGNLLYNATRTILNATRSIEPLIMGLIFVIWVGIGPFAGVLALTLHSIASLGKLYSEQIENIDEGPIEALKSTGANQLQTIIYAVVPQIVPPYIAFTMYRWDINVRMSTIIGFVGGGGIGLLLNQQINLLRYRDAGVAVLAIAIVVSVLDYASASIRERFI